MKYVVFNPEQYEIRNIPGFVMRLETNQVVAFSRISPKQRDHILNYVSVQPNGSCGCADKSCESACIGYLKTSALICPCDDTAYDVSDNGRVIRGSANYPARQFTIDRNGEWISINTLERIVIG